MKTYFRERKKNFSYLQQRIMMDCYGTETDSVIMITWATIMNLLKFHKHSLRGEINIVWFLSRSILCHQCYYCDWHFLSESVSVDGWGWWVMADSM